MLEKIDAQQIFLRDGFAEIITTFMEKAIPADKASAKLDSLVQLSSITQGVDTIIKNPLPTLLVRACGSITAYILMSIMRITLFLETHLAVLSLQTMKMHLQCSILHRCPMWFVRNIMDYIRTFPARIDGLNVAFIAPTNMQHIVAAVHLIAKGIGKVGGCCNNQPKNHLYE